MGGKFWCCHPAYTGKDPLARYFLLKTADEQKTPRFCAARCQGAGASRAETSLRAFEDLPIRRDLPEPHHN